MQGSMNVGLRRLAWICSLLVAMLHASSGSATQWLSEKEALQEAKLLIQTMTSSSGESNPEKRAWALWVLRLALGNPDQAVPRVLRLLESENQEARWVGARSLAVVRSSKRISDALGRTLLDYDTDVRIAAACALAESGSATRLHRDPLVRMFSSSSDEERVCADFAVETIQEKISDTGRDRSGVSKDAEKALYAAIMSGSHETTRMMASALGAVHSGRALASVPKLVGLAGDPADFVADGARLALKAIGQSNPGIASRIVSANPGVIFADTTSRVRALGYFDVASKEVVRYLVSILSGAGSSEEKIVSAEALGRLGTEASAARPALRTSLYATDRRLAEAAGIALIYVDPSYAAEQIPIIERSRPNLANFLRRVLLSSM